MRHWSWACLAAALCLPATLAVAQPPAEDTDDWNYEFGISFQADAVYLRRDNSSHGVPVIAGPESFRLDDADFNFEPGTRLTVGLAEGDYEFTVSFLSLESWSERRSGLLVHGLDFDGPAAYGGAIGGAQAAVDFGSDPNFLTSGTYFSPLNAAANAGGETDALDFLAAGASVSTRYTSDFQDIEVNYSQRRQPGRWIRWGLGFRNVKVRENAYAAMSGVFGSVDADGVGAPSTPGLPSAPLIGAGLSFPTTGGGTDDGFVAADTLNLQSRTQTENRLYGMQAIADMLWLESDYFDLGGFGKVGVFYNDVSGSIAEQYAGTGGTTSNYIRTLNDSKSDVAFVGHAGVTGRVYLKKNIRIVAGYEVVYLAGLALAPDQTQTATTSVTGTASLKLDTDGDLFIHGGRLGLEILFW